MYHEVGVVACDCVNGTTYIGRLFQSRVKPGVSISKDKRFIENSNSNVVLTEYVVASTRQLTEADVCYKDAAKVHYGDPKQKKFNRKIVLSSKHRVASHLLEILKIDD